MSDVSTRIAAGGRIVIPVDFRRELGADIGDEVILRLVEGFSGPEIAEHTGMSPDSVRVHLHRGLKLLRERLGEEGAER